MAIESLTNIGSSNAATQTKSANQTQQGSSKRAPTVETNVDSISFSAAQGLKKAQDIINATPIVNEERVASIKKALDAGNYQVNPDQVADKLMRLEKAITDST